MLSRIVNATATIPFDKLKTDFKKHKQRVKSIQKLQKVSSTVWMKEKDPAYHQ